MSRIFITGSADGLGLMAAKSLIGDGHQVVLHARSQKRAEETKQHVHDAEEVLIADLSDTAQTKSLANQVNRLGHFDAIIHNAGVYQVSNDVIFHVNIIAPYLLTCLIEKPKRLIYLSSGMHRQGDPALKHLSPGSAGLTYSDSKLHMVLLAKAVARKWPDVYANAVDPGWVPTKMGGAGAPDDLSKGPETQSWLAVSNDEAAKVSGQYFFHKRQQKHLAAANKIETQDKFLQKCEEISGIRLPA